MKTRYSPLIFAFALFASALPAPASPLVSGSYSIKVPISPVLPNGRYPVFVNEGVADTVPIEGRLDVTTSATGKISGKVEVFADLAEVTGQVSVRKSGVKLKLRGKTSSGKRVSVTTKLNGTVFTGTV